MQRPSIEIRAPAAAIALPKLFTTEEEGALFFGFLRSGSPVGKFSRLKLEGTRGIEGLLLIKHVFEPI